MPTITWDLDADFNGEKDLAGVVHDATDDHPGAGTLASGYLYDGIDSVYSTLYGSNLVGWWPLHEWSGQANDLSGNGNNSTTVSGPVQGVAGRGNLTVYSFDGTDDYVFLPSGILTATDDITVCMWVKQRKTRATALTLSGDINLTLRIDRDGVDDDQLDIFDGTWNESLGSVPHNTWTHVTLTYDESAGSGEVFINGSSSTTFSMSTSSQSNTTTIGNDASPATGSEQFEGELADVRVYNSALTASQIKTLYEWGSGDYAVPPDNNDDGVSYYNFNSANANDQWGSNDGTVNGATHVANGGPRGDGAYSFDGTDDEISFGTTSMLNNTGYSVSVWVNLDSTGTEQAAFTNYNNTTNDMFILADDGSGNHQYNHDGGGSIEFGSSVSGVWTHLTVTMDGSEMIGYVNGIRENSTSISSPNNPDNGANYRIGEHAAGSGDLSGDIDEVRIYNRALDLWEVQELYQYGSTGRDMRQHTVNAVT